MAELQVFTGEDMARLVEEEAEKDAALLVEATAKLDLSPVIQQFGTWAVTEYGVECLTQYYPIEKHRLFEDEPFWGWWVHMAEKTWVDMFDFGRALAAARKHHYPKVRLTNLPKQPRETRG